MNNLHMQIQANEIKLTPFHQELALSKIHNVRSEIIFDMVSKLKLSDKVDQDFFFNLAKKHLDNAKYMEAALVIQKFSFYSKIDENTMKLIIKNLISTQKIPTLKQFIADSQNLELKKEVIALLTTNENCKFAAEFIKEWKFNIEDFPEVKERLMKKSMKYYISRHFQVKPGQEDYMTLDRIEELLMASKPMLGYMVDDLVNKDNNLNRAKGICLRHGLENFIKKETYSKLKNYQYIAEDDPTPEDVFGPSSSPKENYIHLPQHVRVEMISTEHDVDKLSDLLSEPYIGVDSEWRPSLIKND